MVDSKKYSDRNNNPIESGIYTHLTNPKFNRIYKSQGNWMVKQEGGPPRTLTANQARHYYPVKDPERDVNELEQSLRDKNELLDENHLTKCREESNFEKDFPITNLSA